jgi:hypothetical protein
MVANWVFGEGYFLLPFGGYFTTFQVSFRARSCWPIVFRCNAIDSVGFWFDRTIFFFSKTKSDGGVGECVEIFCLFFSK